MTHRYGPHRAEDLPKTLTVSGVGKYAQDVQIPFPPGLAAQRRHINSAAWHAARQPERGEAQA